MNPDVAMSERREWLATLRVDERVSRFNQMTREALQNLPAVYTKPLATVRAERAEWARRSEVGDARWITIPRPGAPLRARVLQAAVPRAICLHVHGGGWVLGAADQQDPLLQFIRDAAGVTVVSIEYRLAPENPFPAAVEDVTDALAWLLDQGASTLGATRSVVCGESAGANLLVVAMARLRARARLSNLRGACLNYGTFDLSGTASLHAADPGTPFLDRRLSAWFGEQYVSADLYRHPEVSPLYADLSGLPRAQFLVGSADPVIDDSLLMDARWRAAGSPAELCVVPGGLHGLIEFNSPLTRQACERVAEFIVRACPA